MQHDMFIIIGFRNIHRLTVIHSDAQHAVVSAPLEALVDQAAEYFFGLSRSVIEEKTDIAFIGYPGINPVGPVKRETLLAGL